MWRRWHGPLAAILAATAFKVLADLSALFADAYDAITHDRPYRVGPSSATAIAELERQAGGQFDPDVVHALVRVLEEGVVEERGVAGASGLGVPGTRSPGSRTTDPRSAEPRIGDGCPPEGTIPWRISWRISPEV